MMNTIVQNVPSILDRFKYNKPATSIEEASFDFFRENTKMLYRFVEIADEYRDAGNEHWSATAVIQVIRWEDRHIQTTDEQFLWNNNYTATAARIYNELAREKFFHERKYGGHVHVGS